MFSARSMFVRLAAFAALSQAGCYFTDEGLSPPTQSFYYPTGLAISPGHSALYVVNSDFDLQYNGGTVQVLNLEEDVFGLRARLAEMLNGIRCVQGAADACAALQTVPSTVGDWCRTFPFRDVRATATSDDCKSPNECASGVCTDGVCVPCAGSSDCPGGTGYCFEGVCQLDENKNRILTPSACTPMAPPFAVDPTTQKSSFATIGAFASGALLAANPDGPGARLFVPVRGDPSITWFNVIDDLAPETFGDVARLDCGQDHASLSPNPDRRCFDDHRMGIDPYDNLRDLTLPVEPMGLDISDDGTVMVSAHQIQGAPAVGLSTNRWPATATGNPRPTFEFVLTSNVPAGPMEVAHVPTPGIVKKYAGGDHAIAYQPGFLVTYNASSEVDLYRYNDDRLSSPPRPFLTRAALAPISVNADGSDSRGIVLDPSRREACERSCGTLTPDAPGCQGEPDADGQLTEDSCLRCCVDTPIDVYIANRAPASLLLGRVRTKVVEGGESGLVGLSAYDSPEVYGSVSLTTGPSKVALGKVVGLDGELHTRVFAAAFESRMVFAYDPEAQRVDTTIRTGRGPHAIAIDTPSEDAPGPRYAHLYVGHFTDSYLGVVDLDMRHPETYGVMFASIGMPTPPLESK